MKTESVKEGEKGSGLKTSSEIIFMTDSWYAVKLMLHRFFKQNCRHQRDGKNDLNLRGERIKCFHLVSFQRLFHFEFCVKWHRADVIILNAIFTVTLET